MLAISPLRTSNGDERDRQVAGFSTVIDDFSDIGFSGGDLLDDIDFDDLFVGFDDGDILPDLELDPSEILAAEFSVGGEEESGTAAVEMMGVDGCEQEMVLPEVERREEKSSSQGEEAMSVTTSEEDSVTVPAVSSASREGERGRKSSATHAKSSHGKRKVKVDWTPELHRRFVQAVEQLGVDKAVPSRILELMGIDCLTRHNIASHLQKYRSHRKHLLAREAEAASWSQRRQMYAGGGGGRTKREMNPWLAPTIGFPPPPPPPLHHFRPLHVWGHPTVDHSLVHVWPKHLVPSRSPPPPPWLPQPPPPLPDPSYWHPHYPRGCRDGWVPNALTQGTPCFPQPMPPTRFPAPPVPGILPHPLYRPNSAIPLSSKPSASQLQINAHPSKESIDAAIGDVLAKPWLPLPLGLKPPSVESVLVELQKEGISNIPPTYS